MTLNKVKEEGVKDTVLFETKYIKVKKRDNWYDLSSSQGTNELVAVTISNKQGQWLVRNENCPPYYQNNKNNFSLVALTGMIENRESPKKAVIRELLEESGLTKKDYKLEYMGWVFTNKQSDLKIHLFRGHITQGNPKRNNKKLIGKGDGTKGEVGSYAMWRTRGTIYKNSKCGILYQLMAITYPR